MNFIKKMQDLIYTQEGDGENVQDDYETGFYDDAPVAETAPNNNTRTFNDRPEDVRTTSNVNMTSGTSIEMKVIRPEKLDSVTQIADYLTSRNTVLLNLEGTNKETARRLLDFLNGVAYAVGGKLKKVANSTFVITPSNVSISGEQISDTSDHEAI